MNQITDEREKQIMDELWIRLNQKQKFKAIDYVIKRLREIQGRQIDQTKKLLPYPQLLTLH